MTTDPRRIIFPFFLLLFFSSAVWSQSGKCRSVSADKSAACASILVEYAAITSSRLFGKVNWPGEGPVIVEVYKVSKVDTKAGLHSATYGKEPVIVLETNERGEFCHPGLVDGLYVVKFGIEGVGWNCTWIQVRIAKNAPERKVRVGLEIGI